MEEPLALIYADPRSLRKSDWNWRTHPKAQADALRAVLDRTGWAGAILVNEVSGQVIDGHLRIDEAIKRGDKTVPVLVGSWTPEQEKLILGTLDPLGTIGRDRWGKTKVTLLDDLDAGKDPALNDLLLELEAQAEQALAGVDEADYSGMKIGEDKEVFVEVVLQMKEHATVEKAIDKARDKFACGRGEALQRICKEFLNAS